MPDRVRQGPVAARTRDAGGSDGDFAGGVRGSFDCYLYLVLRPRNSEYCVPVIPSPEFRNSPTLFSPAYTSTC